MKEVEQPHKNFGFTVEFYKENIYLGQIGKLSPKIADQFDIRNDVYYAEIDIASLYQFSKKGKTRFKTLSRFPAVHRDLSLLLGVKLSYSDICKSILGLNINILQEIHLIDVYQDDKLESGKKSYTLRLKFQDERSTLKDDVIDEIVSKIVVKLSNELNAQIRK